MPDTTVSQLVTGHGAYDEPGQSSTAVLAFQPEAAWTTPPAWLGLKREEAEARARGRALAGMSPKTTPEAPARHRSGAPADPRSAMRFARI